MKNPLASPAAKNGKPLICPICDHDHCWKRTTLMNTKGATFFRIDWANRSAVNYVCDACGYITWFFEDPETTT